LLNLTQEAIRSEIENSKYLGFQVHKHFEVADNSIRKLLSNSFICQKMENDQLISLIDISRLIKKIKTIQKNEALYLKIDKTVTGYLVAKGSEINEQNRRYPDRYLLLKQLDEQKSKVVGFGDFYEYDNEEMLSVYVINPKNMKLLCSIIYKIIASINRWIDLTGSEVIFDQDNFRFKQLNKTPNITA